MNATRTNRVEVVTPDNHTEEEEGCLNMGGAGLECSIYQNYGAAEVLVQGMAGMVDQRDVEAIIRAQKKMLQRFEKTNEMLSNCNGLSATRLERAAKDFKGHSQHLVQLKRDLDSVFKRIRALKAKVAAQHPQSFKAVTQDQGEEQGEEDDEYDLAIRERRLQVSPIPES